MRVIREPELRALKPFLKWAGGKRWLFPQINDYLPNAYDCYFEPFLGGGAVFFALRPGAAVLSDLNPDLIDLYKVLKEDWQSLFDGLAGHQKMHCKEYYYEIRNSEPRGRLERASRFLYLNRTCFNGLYRVNLAGKFNVPIGTKTKIIFEDESFKELSEALSNSELEVSDFESTIRRASRGDFLYVDPPYTVAHNFNGFLKYNDSIFSWDDQIRLRVALEDAALRGVSIIVSNANHVSIKELYRDFGQTIELPRHSVIAGPSGRRVRTSELLFCVRGGE